MPLSSSSVDRRIPEAFSRSWTINWGASAASRVSRNSRRPFGGPRVSPETLGANRHLGVLFSGRARPFASASAPRAPGPSQGSPPASWTLPAASTSAPPLVVKQQAAQDVAAWFFALRTCDARPERLGATLPFRPATPLVDETVQVVRVNPAGVADPHVRELTAVAEAVHGGGADAETGSHLRGGSVRTSAFRARALPERRTVG